MNNGYFADGQVFGEIPKDFSYVQNVWCVTCEQPGLMFYKRPEDSCGRLIECCPECQLKLERKAPHDPMSGL